MSRQISRGQIKKTKNKIREGEEKLMRLNVLPRLSLSFFSLRDGGQAKIAVYYLSFKRIYIYILFLPSAGSDSCFVEIIISIEMLSASLLLSTDSAAYIRALLFLPRLGVGVGIAIFLHTEHYCIIKQQL